ncbi:hypothetical protein CYY_004427 [Polysphondylium violaceum]|uniref:Ankyrin repeat-containing protein n=1 Tax=Polysphondylium violaceum TaxID=133409 RepID=A0A8J4PTC5_9MYCE|nr:hypothetical protein CYY_004427 [Polysphondylium violaceum]
MGKVKLIDFTENEYFYQGLFAQKQIKKYVFELPSDNFIAFDHYTREKISITAPSFWSVYRNLHVRITIFSFIHRPLLPFHKYSDINSIKWIFRYGSMQLLIDKVKRDEYLCDILFISKQLDQFKLINDFEFYSLFNQKYKRYLETNQMVKVKEFLDSVLNNSNNSILNRFSFVKKTNNNDNNQQSKSFDQVLKGYKAFNVLHFSNFKRALESKRFELGKFVLDEWLVSNNQKLTSHTSWNSMEIYIGNREILQHYCEINVENKYGLKLRLNNLYNRDDFQECMNLIQETGNIDFKDSIHMDHFKTKENILWFLKHDYLYSIHLFNTIVEGNRQQLSALPILLKRLQLTNDEFVFLFSLPYAHPKRAEIIYYVLNRFTVEEFGKLYPKYIASSLSFFVDQYKAIYTTGDYSQYPSVWDIPISLESLSKNGNTQNIRSLVNTFYNEMGVSKNAIQLNPNYGDNDAYLSESDEEESPIDTILQSATKCGHLQILKMLFTEFEEIHRVYCTFTSKSFPLIQAATAASHIEILDYLFSLQYLSDQDTTPLFIKLPSPHSLAHTISKDDTLLVSYYKELKKKNRIQINI